MNYNGTLEITHWADVSIIHPGVTYNTVATSISYSYTYPVFLVESVIPPYLPLSPFEAKWYEELLADPLFYIMFLVFAGLTIELGYLRKRERRQVQRLAYKNIVNWLGRRDKSWKKLVIRPIIIKNYLRSENG